MRIKRLVSSFILFLFLTVLSTTFLYHFSTQVDVQAATPGLLTKELFLYEGQADILKVRGATGTVQWKSSDTSIAQVSSTGKVTAKKKGTAVITAIVSSKKYKCKVTVDKIILNYQDLKLKPKKGLRLSMINSEKKVMYPSNKVKWSSSDSNVVTVDDTGYLYTRDAGTATITGTMYNGTKASCKVQVEGLRFINVPEYISVGDTYKIEYIYIPPLDQKDELIWTIEYDPGEYESWETEPIVPYSFNQESNTLSALHKARLVSVILQAKGDPNIIDSIGVEIVDSQVAKVNNEKEDYSNQESDNTIEATDDIMDNKDTMANKDTTAEDTQPPLIEDNYLAASSTPTLRTSERFIINQDCSVTIYDAPILYLPMENWDIWEKFYYTLDGTTPTQNSTRFSSKIYLEQNCTLKMIGVGGDITSKVLTINFNLMSNFAKFWGTNPVVDVETCAFAIKNNVADLSVLNQEELLLYHKTKQILEEIITPGMTDYDKLKAIHDYICRNVNYGYGSNDQDAYGALVLNKCVCTGYADAFQLLTGLCDIHVMSINGLAAGEPHMWNLVMLEGEWYHVDCTWDDGDPNQMKYRYFLVNDAHFPHVWTKEYTDPLSGRTYTFPAANGEKYNTNTIDRPYQPD